MSSWTVTSAGLQNAVLSNCDASKILPGYELLFIVTRGILDHYGKYEIMRIADVDGWVIIIARLVHVFKKMCSGIDR